MALTVGPAGARRIPWWVNALDVLTIATFVAAAGFAASHGARFRVGPVFVSIHSPWRVAAWAAIVAAIRHALFRRPALPMRVARAAVSTLRRAAAAARSGGAATVRSHSLRAVAFPFVASRCAVLLVGFLAVAAIGFPADRERPRFSDNPLLNLVVKWDGEWYLNVATDGYVWDDSLRHRARLAFFPAYPMLSRGVGRVVGSTIGGLLIVALVAFAWALTYVFRLARDELGIAEADAAVLLLAFYPFAVFYSAAYTESLFLLAAVGAFYHFRRDQWLPAATWGVLAGLTRPNGFLLAVVLGVWVVGRAVTGRRALGRDRAERRRSWSGAAVSCAPLLGVGAYSLFVYWLSGDAMMWLRLHEYWGRGDRTIVDLVVSRYHDVMTQGIVEYAAASPVDLLNTCAAIFALACAWPVARRLGLPYGAFVAVNVLAPLLSGTTLSVGRLTATLFPLFLWLAASIRSDRRGAWVGTFAALQGFVAVMFFTWRRLF